MRSFFKSAPRRGLAGRAKVFVSGVLAQHPYQKSFAELFQKRPLAPAGASAFFFLELFLFVPLKAKRKSGAELNVTLNRYIQISIAINFYLQIVT